jgi:hypothetical protein
VVSFADHLAESGITVNVSKFWTEGVSWIVSHVLVPPVLGVMFVVSGCTTVVIAAGSAASMQPASSRQAARGRTGLWRTHFELMIS